MSKRVANVFFDGCTIQDVQRHITYNAMSRLVACDKVLTCVIHGEYNEFHRAVMKLLINRYDIGIDKEDCFRGSSLLCRAAKRGHCLWVEWLLDNGADLHYSFMGWNALMYALASERKDVVLLLLRRGAHLSHQQRLAMAVMGGVDLSMLHYLELCRTSVIALLSIHSTTCLDRNVVCMIGKMAWLMRFDKYVHATKEN